MNAFHSSPLVVVVDDDPWVRELLATHLELHGFSFRCYPSGEAFLASPELANTSCLILDSNLPALSGLDVLGRLNETKHSFPVIFYSGEIDPRLASRARAAGAIECLEKAASPTVLIDAINRALAARSE